MPPYGLTYTGPGTDGLFLGFGEFLVFSVFAAHAAREGTGPLAAVVAGLLSGMNLTMLAVALQWPLRALEPVLPLALLFAAVALSAERFLIQRLADSISEVNLVL